MAFVVHISLLLKFSQLLIPNGHSYESLRTVLQDCYIAVPAIDIFMINLHESYGQSMLAKACAVDIIDSDGFHEYRLRPTIHFRIL